jgi:Zn-dependent protease
MEQIVVKIMALLMAVTVHEMAHGWVAHRLGDPTPAHRGRITLNPVAHIDIFGTIVLPALLLVMNSPFLLGWAKPVPINPGYFRNPRKGMAMVALSGPASNLVMGFVAGVLLKAHFLWPDSMGNVAAPLYSFLAHAVGVNVVLAVFNMLPVPPLDGGHFLQGVLPRDTARFLDRIEPYGMLIIIALLYLGVLNVILKPIYILLFRFLI